jgi:DNA repair protein RecN (Recombination protein N)
MNILSGETGAGKSILVGAVNLILGSRASQEMIRTGANEASVEAVFPLSGVNSLKARLHEWGLECSDEILIRRSINRNGRNRVFINDQMVTLQQLQQLARGLVSISGQHENQLLMDPDIHLGLLDAFGGLEPFCREVGSLYSDWFKTREKLNKLRRFKEEQVAQLEYMRFQLQELKSAKLQQDEDKTLEQERNLLRHAATLMEASEGAYQKLYAGRGAVLEQLADVEKSVETLRRIDPTQEPLLSHLEQARIQIEELAHALQQYAHRVSFDPQRLSAVEERLASLQRLGKKYGGSVEAMLTRLAELRDALGQEEDADLREEQMVKELEQLSQAYLEKARELSKLRREAAEHLSQEVQRTLASLDMSRARFAVSFHRDADGDPATGTDPSFASTGIDRVEFLLSANPGEDLKPLVRIASGGELSRILLALKSLLSRKGEAETLIFDEVDAGIGGRTAELVGLQLKRLADKHQVICITHLPQIACYGEHHYKVAKEMTGEETVTNICMLSSKDRVEELARMLGGISISEKTRAHARELLQRAQKGLQDAPAIT